VTFAASCLCGAVTWRVRAPVPPMFHCHCAPCRKTHGTAFATYVAVPSSSISVQGEAVVRWRGEADGERCFCRHCGSVVPHAVAGMTFAPAGSFDADPGARPALHAFVGARAPWYPITDGLPQHEAHPPGVDQGAVVVGPLVPQGPRPGPSDRPRGSCLCGAVTYELEGGPRKRRYCHCGRCRKAGAAAHAANLTTSFDGVVFTRGEEDLSSYKVPEARYFTQVFCKTCGSLAPRRDASRGIAVVPMGSLDDDPQVPSRGHIFVGSKAPWYEIADDLPQFLEYPPSV
jgi:hypothetical protein